MSGIEVAGLVLAIIPVITKVLGEIDKTPDKIARFRTWRREIPTFIAQLNAQRIRLVISLQMLFHLAGLPEPDLKDVNQASSATLWNRADVVTTLKQAHGEVYDAVESDIVQIRKLTEELCAKLGMGRVVETGDVRSTWTPRVVVPSPLRDFRDRLLYSQSGKEIRDLLLQIDSRQQSIRGTLRDMEMLKPRQKYPPKIKHATYRVARRDASKLHAVLEQVLGCRLQHAHSVRLQLDYETSSATGGAQQQAHSCFRLGISLANSTAVRFAEVHVLEDGTTSQSRPLTGTSPQNISDMCSVIEKHQHPGQSCLGFSIESPSGAIPRLVGVFEPRVCQVPMTNGPCLSLYQILEQPPQWRGVPMRLKERDRRFLATRITLYALQLQCSPWASQKWSNQDILLMSGDWNGVTNPLELQRPFVSKKFDNHNQAIIAAQNQPLPHHSNRQFFLALATLIMEICLGQVIKYTSTNDSTSSCSAPDVAKLLALQNWRENNEGDISDAYKTAIQFCLASALDPSFHLDDSSNTDLAIEKVVVPLVKEYEIFTGTSLSGGVVAFRT